ncbi:MAG: response regulator [Geminicoccaceae bacterium]
MAVPLEDEQAPPSRATGPGCSGPAPSRILIVDDSDTMRLKLGMAVRRLGYEVSAVPDGPAALAALDAGTYDTVLLDIMMPGMSGFDVLAAMKASPRLAHLPVVVISSLNDDLASVARAIELGADDFLPKDFDLVILRARVGAGVERKRLRDLELAYLDQVRRLTRAASALEAGDFDPRDLQLQDIAARNDGLGTLASVFVAMAEKVYAREQTLRTRIADLGRSYRLSGLALVMAAAALWATVGVASRLVPGELALPDEVYGFARTLVAGPAILLFALVAGGAGTIRPRPGSWPGFLVFGLCCAVFQIGLFRSFSLIGVTITVFLTVCLPPVLAFLWSLLRRTEAISRRTVVALLLAALGLACFIGTDTAGASTGATVLGLALSLAASIAFVIMTQAARALAVDHSPLLVSGLGLVVAALILAPVALLAHPGSWQDIASSLGTWESLTVLLYLGLGPTAMAYVCYCTGMARCRSAVVGLVASMIEPAVAAGLAFLFLRESLGPWQTAGCVVLLAAMLVLWLDENRTPAAAKVRSSEVVGKAPRQA